MTYRDVLALFGRDELAELMGVSPDTVRTWYFRQRIPTEYMIEIAFTKKGKKGGIDLKVIRDLVNGK